MTTNRNDARTKAAGGVAARSFPARAWRAGRMIALALLVAAPVVAGGCGKDEVTRPGGGPPPPTPPNPQAKAFADSGWARFTTGDYDGALGLFDQAVGVDSRYLYALQGRGWSLLRLDRLNEADAAFDSALVHFENWQDAASEADAYVGKSFTASWSGDYDAAALAGARAAEIGGESYRFRGDTAINVDHPRLIAAEAYIRLGKYMQAYEMLVTLDVTVLGRIDPDSQEFVAQMIEEIHRISLVIST